MIYDDLKNIINVNKRAPGKYEQGFNDPATTDPEIVIIGTVLNYENSFSTNDILVCSGYFKYTDLIVHYNMLLFSD